MKRKKIKANLLVAIVASVALLCLAILMNLPEESVDFQFAENMGKWQLSPGSQYRLLDDGVQLSKGEGQLFLVIPQLNLNADFYDVCVIEGAMPVAYAQAQLLFISPFNNRFDYNFRYVYETGINGKMNKRYIDLLTHGAWQGLIRAVLILPTTSAKPLTLKRVKFVRANLWTNIKMWWSTFVYYRDPTLGTCFAMATPIFMGKLFNPFFVPIFWGLLVLGGLVLIGARYLKVNRKVSKIAIILVLLIIIAALGVLDLRNNVVHLKAIARNINLYWGKSIQEKRGIVIGDPAFVDFMKFCDENIPIEARVFNQVPNEVPGTAINYLSCVQYWANFRPRFPKDLSRSFYIFYKPPDKINWEVRQEQPMVNEYFTVLPGGKLLQEIKLWQPSRALTQINIWLKDEAKSAAKVEVVLLSDDGKTLAGKTKYVSRSGEGAVFSFTPRLKLKKGAKVFLQIENQGEFPFQVGTVYGEQYREGDLSRAGKKLYNDLAFRLIYQPKNLVLFKGFSEDAYILAEPEEPK